MDRRILSGFEAKRRSQAAVVVVNVNRSSPAWRRFAGSYRVATWVARLHRSVRRLALPKVARRHAKMLAEDAPKMREVVKAPGEGDFADMAMRQHRRRQVAF